jgi:hypothetical protein
MHDCPATGIFKITESRRFIPAGKAGQGPQLGAVKWPGVELTTMLK